MTTTRAKRAISLVMALLLVVTLLPAAVFAADVQPAGTYKVTVKADENGAASVKGDTVYFAENDTVTITVEPKEGYEVDKVEGVYGVDQDVDVTTATANKEYSFKMPAGDVTVNVTFKEKPYEVTVKADENGTANVKGDAVYFAEDDTVAITVEPKAGYEVDEVKGVYGVDQDVDVTTVTANKEYSFAMPAADVTVNVTFKKIATSEKTYAVTVKADENGTASVKGDTVYFAENDTVTITVEPKEGYEVDKVEGVYGVNKDVDVTTVTANKEYSFKMPAGDVTVTVTFGQSGSTDEPKPPVTTGKLLIADDVYSVLVEAGKAEADSTYTFADGEVLENQGPDGMFTIYGRIGGTSKIDKTDSAIFDGYKFIHRFNLGGKAGLSDGKMQRAIGFKTTGAATVNVWAVSGGAGRHLGLLDAEGNVIVTGTAEAEQNTPFTETLKITAAGEYFLGGVENNNYIIMVEVIDEGGDQPGPGGDEPGPDVPPEPTEITISIDTSRITVRKTETLRYTLTPADAEYGTIYWVSDDTSVLSVTTSGTATGVKTGKANVTAYVLKSAADGLAESNILAQATREIQVVSATTYSGGSSSGGTSASTSNKTNANGDTVRTQTNSNGDKTITVTDKSGNVLVTLQIPAQTPELGYRFEDVPAGHWAEAAIQAMAALKVFQGVSATGHIFDMNSAVTRGTMAQILFNLSQGKAGMTNAFADSANAWYSDAVAWAAAAGVVTGVSDTSFAPNDSITREQLITMLYRYAQLLALDTNVTADMGKFVDADEIDSWASAAMTWAVGKGLIIGKGAGTLDPTAAASRAEAAVIIDRFLQMV